MKYNNRFNFGDRFGDEAGSFRRESDSYDSDGDFEKYSDEEFEDIFVEGLGELLAEGEFDEDKAFLEKATQDFAKKSVLENLTRLKKLNSGIMPPVLHLQRTFDSLVEGTPLYEHYEERLEIARSNAQSFVDYMGKRNNENANTLYKLLRWTE